MTQWNGSIHPAAELFPMIQGDAFDELVDDIKTNGLREPCWLNAEGVLLDGRNRIAACQKAGIEPKFRTFSGDDEVGFIVSLNLRRRHLNQGQSSMVSVDIMPMYEAQARERQRAAGGDRKSDASKPLEAPGPQAIPRAPQARDLAAAATGVSGRSVGRAKRIADNAPDLADDVRQGRKNLREAEAEVRRREAEKRAQDERRAELDALVARLESGETVVLNMRDDLARAVESRGLLVRIDRGTPWGNPFILDDDGDRDTVIGAYRDHYLPHKPSLLSRLGELKGKALGCWCAPESCHGDVLAEQAR